MCSVRHFISSNLVLALPVVSPGGRELLRHFSFFDKRLYFELATPPSEFRVPSECGWAGVHVPVFATPG